MNDSVSCRGNGLGNGLDNGANGAPEADGQVWARPQVMVGDATSASQRAADPQAWAFEASVIDGLETVIGARRDIRRYRPDLVPDDVLRRVLQAGHRAPSVGHSQPWRFIVVTEPGTRERAAAMADKERLRQAGLLEPDRARRLLDLQLEGIREAPVGIVVACDRRTAATGVLGRATFTDADLWSCACAIENMWVMARGLGLGMGWVTLFQPDELADLMHLPDGVQTLGWLCLGWPNERPPAPGLERHGWSKRMPLDDVIMHERWPSEGRGEAAATESDAAAPPPPPSHLSVPAPTDIVGVADQADALLTPVGSLGVLDRAVNAVLATGASGQGGALILAGADHPVTALGVSAFAQDTTREVLAAAVVGQAVGAVAAQAAGLKVLPVDAGVDGEPVPGALNARSTQPRGNLRDQDAMTRPDVMALVAAGRDCGRSAAPGQLVALGEIGLGNTTLAAAMACVLLGASPQDLVGLGAGADTAIMERKQHVVAAALARLEAAGRLPATDPLDVLAAVGGPEIAFLTGAALGAAEAGSCVVLDGLATSVAALVAVRAQPSVRPYLVAGQVSRERAHRAVLTELGLEPLLDLRLRAGEGAGACLAAGLLKTGLQVRAQTGRTE